MEDSFNVVYAKSGGSPKYIELETRREVVKFFMNELNNIDFISINDNIIDKNKLIDNNIKLSRYLKLTKIVK